MVLRYFGSKAGLFEAALAHLMDLSVIFNWRKSEIGENLASIFSGDGLDPKPSVPVMVASMIALSTSDQEARDIAARVAAEHVIDPTAGWLGPPDAHSRAAQLFLLSTGFVLYMHAIPVLRGKKEADAQMADWFRRTVQEIVDQVEIDPVRT